MTWSSKKMQENEHIVEVKRNDGSVPPLLYDFLRLATAHGLERFIVNKMPAHIRKMGQLDAKGNFIVEVKNKDGSKSETLFSSHMDTVHNVDIKEIPEHLCPIINILKIKEDAPQDMEKHKGFIWGGIKPDKGEKKDGYIACQLGADDKVGVWIMCEMIDHEIPGLYIFHVGEEKGCVGSNWLLKNTPDVLKGIKRAVAFDRMDTTHVIAHQRSQRCSSFKFSDALAKAISEHLELPPAAHFKPDIHGAWTDTAVYMDVIPEVCNLSVGYYDQHSGDERLDVWWLVNKFLPAVLQVEWEKLPIIRDPKEKTTYQYPAHYHGNYEDRTWDPDLQRFVSTAEYKARYLANPNQFVDWKYITLFTDPAKVPPWEPEKGIPFGITADGLRVITRRWLDKAEPDRRAKEFSRILLTAEAEELAHLISDEQLKKFKRALGDKEYQRIIDTPEPDKGDEEDADDIPSQVVQQQPKQETLALPPPPPKTDTDGFPFDDKEMLERSQKKMAIVATYITHRSNLKLARELMGKMDHLVSRHHKFAKEINRQAKISRNMYRAINKLLFDATALVFDSKCDISAFINAKQAAITYMRENAHEQGFPEAA